MIIYSKIEKIIFFGFVRDNIIFMKNIKYPYLKNNFEKKIEDNFMEIYQNEIYKEEKKF
jgi:hypothetical protein